MEKYNMPIYNRECFTYVGRTAWSYVFSRKCDNKLIYKKIIKKALAGAL